MQRSRRSSPATSEDTSRIASAGGVRSSLASAALALLGGCLAFVGSHVGLGLALIVLLGGADGHVVRRTAGPAHRPRAARARHEHAFASAARRAESRLHGRAADRRGPADDRLAPALHRHRRDRSARVPRRAAGDPATARRSRRTSTAESHPGASLLRDPAFAFLLAAGTLASIVYLSYETLLPISLVQSHGVAPAAWGILLAINPTVVVLCQIRLTSARQRRQRVHTARGRDRRDGNAVPVPGRSARRCRC